jgi:acetoacetyl-CoA synthetase
MSSQAAPVLMDNLTAIWRRVLRRSRIEAHENFFDLGGDPAAAAELFQQISALAGREIPPAFIYQFPTLAAMARLLEQAEGFRVQPLVLLKPGGDSAPVYLIHGLGGSVLEFFHLIKHLQTGGPVYGTQLRGSDGVEDPLGSVEAMASYHLNAIRSVQPHGPYTLVGYSFGGLEALELARQLRRYGEKLALVVMVDSYLHLRQLPRREQVRWISRRVSKLFSTIARPRSYVRRVWGSRHLKVRGVASEAEDLKGQHGVRSALPSRPGAKHVQDCAHGAWKSYRPGFYEGNVRFIKAAVDSAFPRDPAAVWGSLIGDFKMKVAPGDHLEMLTTYSGNLAALLSQYLNESTG